MFGGFWRFTQRLKSMKAELVSSEEFPECSCGSGNDVTDGGCEPLCALLYFSFFPLKRCFRAFTVLWWYTKHPHPLKRDSPKPLVTSPRVSAAVMFVVQMYYWSGDWVQMVLTSTLWAVHESVGQFLPVLAGFTFSVVSFVAVLS